MNRYDKFYLGFVVVLVCALFVSSRLFVTTVQAEDAVAVVSFHDQEVLRVKLNEDSFYRVKGDKGDVVIEVSAGKVRVADEISPLHYCRTQGWVEHTNTPIVCLPNGIKIVLYNNSLTEEDITIR